MKIPDEILQVINKEETIKLVKYYGTDFYKPYLKQLKRKYFRLYDVISEVVEDTNDPNDCA